MKKLILLIAAIAISTAASAQVSTAQYANSSTGTTLNTLTKIVVNAGTPQAQITATTDTSGAIGITTDGAGTSGKPTITYAGIAPCVFDNTVVGGDYVQISSGTGGDCHDAGSTRPTSGQIIGNVAQVGGSAGTYNVLLDKSIIPSSSTPTLYCDVLGSSDTLSAAGTFATTCPTTGLVQGSFLEIRAHGLWTTTATSSPIENIQVNAGGTTALCTHTGNNSLNISQSNLSWDVVCYVHILTTGAPGTATAWGLDEVASNLAGTVVSRAYTTNAASQSFNTSTSQTISVQEIATMVSGQSFTLQELIVRNY